MFVRIVRLARCERRAAVRAVLWLAGAGLAVRVLSYRTITRLAARVPVRPRRTPVDIERCALAVRRATMFIPGASCLVQGLAAACMLRRDGVASVLHIGVRLDARALRAHAWVESGGKIVTGAGDAVGRGVLVQTAFDV
jgi:hypothetical protein